MNEPEARTWLDSLWSEPPSFGEIAALRDYHRYHQRTLPPPDFECQDVGGRIPPPSPALLFCVHDAETVLNTWTRFGGLVTQESRVG